MNFLWGFILSALCAYLLILLGYIINAEPKPQTVNALLSLVIL